MRGTDEEHANCVAIGALSDLVEALENVINNMERKIDPAITLHVARTALAKVKGDS